MIDKILRDIVEKQIPGDDVAILMGGGADSATLLFTCLRLGKKPLRSISNNIFPELGLIREQNIFKNVLLPDPLSP